MKKLASWWMASHTNTASSTKGSCILDRSRVGCFYSHLQENGGAGLSQSSFTLCVFIFSKRTMLLLPSSFIFMGDVDDVSSFGT